MRIDQAIVNTESTLKSVVQALRRRLSLDDNLQCRIIEVSDSGSANTPIAIEHKLGKVPTVFIANIDQDGTVWAVNKGMWTTTDMEVACSAPNAVLTLVVF